jgi:hypothetical protein
VLSVEDAKITKGLGTALATLQFMTRKLLAVKVLDPSVKTSGVATECFNGTGLKPAWNAIVNDTHDLVGDFGQCTELELKQFLSKRTKALSVAFRFRSMTNNPKPSDPPSSEGFSRPKELPGFSNGRMGGSAVWGLAQVLGRYCYSEHSMWILESMSVMSNAGGTGTFFLKLTHEEELHPGLDRNRSVR